MTLTHCALTSKSFYFSDDLQVYQKSFFFISFERTGRGRFSLLYDLCPTNAGSVMFSLEIRWITCNGGYAGWYRSPYGQTGCLILLLEYPQRPRSLAVPITRYALFLFFFSVLLFSSTQCGWFPDMSGFFESSARTRVAWLALECLTFCPFHFPLALSVRLLRETGRLHRMEG